MAYLIEIFIPVGDPASRAKLSGIREYLTDRFGGATAFTRAPAEGTYASHGEVQRDEIVIFEVMSESLDRKWWAGYRAQLEQDFDQEEILIRASSVERL